MNSLTRKTVLLFSSLLLVLGGCGKVVDQQQESPELNKAVNDIAIPINDSLDFDFRYIDAHDVNGDVMEIVIYPGENYTVNGTMIIPNTNFYGDLNVEYALKDSEGNISITYTLIVSVFPDTVVHVQPLDSGAVWHYSDTFFLATKDSVTTSSFEITSISTIQHNSIDEEVFVGRWRNLLTDNSLDLSYIQSSTAEGLYMLGGISETDTLIDPSLKLKNIVTTGDSWNYQVLRYNIEWGKFFRDTSTTTMTCTNALLYVTVPAGTFEAIEYTYSYEYNPINTGNSRSIAAIGNMTLSEDGLMSVGASRGLTRATENQITVKLYYAAGIGYIQNKTYLNGVLVQQKVLVDYTVNESM